MEERVAPALLDEASVLGSHRSFLSALVAIMARSNSIKADSLAPAFLSQGCCVSRRLIDGMAPKFERLSQQGFRRQRRSLAFGKPAILKHPPKFDLQRQRSGQYDGRGLAKHHTGAE